MEVESEVMFHLPYSDNWFPLVKETYNGRVIKNENTFTKEVSIVRFKYQTRIFEITKDQINSQE